MRWSLCCARDGQNETHFRLRPENQMKCRCEWCGSDPLYVAYHDDEWGVPVHDDRRLFEMLVLEVAQAGLSWLTILRKRTHYRQAFHGFDPERIATYSPSFGNPSVIRGW